VLVATLGLLVLQTLGAWYVSQAIGRASDTYGLFATVIGLLSWLSLAAQLVLVAADTRALERYAESARRDPRAHVDVRWER
jgi:uncharacterized BrkB/YihY/UPF0761 family membrane protein